MFENKLKSFDSKQISIDIKYAEEFKELRQILLTLTDRLEKNIKEDCSIKVERTCYAGKVKDSAESEDEIKKKVDAKNSNLELHEVFRYLRR